MHDDDKDCCEIVSRLWNVNMRMHISPEIPDLAWSVRVYPGQPGLRRVRLLPLHQRRVHLVASSAAQEHLVKVLRLPDAKSAVGPEMRRRSCRVKLS